MRALLATVLLFAIGGPPALAAPPSDPCRGPALEAWVGDPKLCVTTFAADVPHARGLALAPGGVLLVESAGKLVALEDRDGDGRVSDGERWVFAAAEHLGLNHGLAVSPDGKWVYASSDTAVYRWPWRGARTPGGKHELVIEGLPSSGHSTRTLLFDREGRLLVSIGSAGNIDADPAEWETRSLIRRFTLSGALPQKADAGEVIARGLRNEVGLAYDSGGRLWGVENGIDNATLDGADVHFDNPGEELNLLDAPGARDYGYPRCWSEFSLGTGSAPGRQHAEGTLPAGLRKDDAWCRDEKNVHPPALVMPAHWAPLGVIEYTGALLPWRGALLVTSHGSWNHAQPGVGQVGRLVVRIDRDPQGRPTGYHPIVGERAADGKLGQGSWGVRPVDVRQAPDGAVYVSDDRGGRVLRVGYRR